MIDLTPLNNLHLFALLVATVLAILVLGVRLTVLAEQLAVRTGLGEAIIGGALLGASTSLSGTVTSVSAAAAGHTELAVSNAIGGIAAQTFFLALGDLAYRSANLEHAAASAENMASAALLGVLLALALLMPYLPAWSPLGIHPGSAVLVAAYLFGLRRVARIREQPMWIARRTLDTRAEPASAMAGNRGRLVTEVAVFFALALAIGLAGYLVASTGLEVAARFGLGQSLVGAALTAVVTSLPELVTTLAAVRRGALQLAVGGIIGGNTFDVLFLSFSDCAYRDGSLYHAMRPESAFWIVVALLMTAVLSFGLIQRERYGPGRIGFESVALIVLYVGAIALQLP